MKLLKLLLILTIFMLIISVSTDCKSHEVGGFDDEWSGTTKLASITYDITEISVRTDVKLFIYREGAMSSLVDGAGNYYSCGHHSIVKSKDGNHLIGKTGSASYQLYLGRMSQTTSLSSQCHDAMDKKLGNGPGDY